MPVAVAAPAVPAAEFAVLLYLCAAVLVVLLYLCAGVYVVLLYLCAAAPAVPTAVLVTAAVFAVPAAAFAVLDAAAAAAAAAPAVPAAVFAVPAAALLLLPHPQSHFQCPMPQRTHPRERAKRDRTERQWWKGRARGGSVCIPTWCIGVCVCVCVCAHSLSCVCPCVCVCICVCLFVCVHA